MNPMLKRTATETTNPRPQTIHPRLPQGWFSHLTKEKSLRVPLRNWLAVVGLAVACFIGCPTGVFALPENEVDYTYYTGPDFQTEVGENILTCDGHHGRTGKVTAYVVVDTYPCNEEGTLFSPTCVECTFLGSPLADCTPIPCPPWIF